MALIHNTPLTNTNTNVTWTDYSPNFVPPVTPNRQAVTITKLNSEEELHTWLQDKGKLSPVRNNYNEIIKSIQGHESNVNSSIRGYIDSDRYFTNLSIMPGYTPQRILTVHILHQKPHPLPNDQSFLSRLIKYIESVQLGAYFISAPSTPYNIATMGDEIFVPVVSSLVPSGCFSFKINSADAFGMRKYVSTGITAINDTNMGGIGKVLEIILKDIIEFKSSPEGTSLIIRGPDGEIIKSPTTKSLHNIRDLKIDIVYESIQNSFAEILPHSLLINMYIDILQLATSILNIVIFDKERVIRELNALSKDRYPLASNLALHFAAITESKSSTDGNKVFLSRFLENRQNVWYSMKTAISNILAAESLDKKLSLELLNSICSDIDSSNRDSIVSKIIKCNYKGIPASVMIAGSDKESLKDIILAYMKANPIPVKRPKKRVDLPINIEDAPPLQTVKKVKKSVELSHPTATNEVKVVEKAPRRNNVDLPPPLAFTGTTGSIMNGVRITSAAT